MIQVFSNTELLAEAVARHIASCAAEAISGRGRFTLALSGGSTPRAAYDRLATHYPLYWNRTHVFWGDERCVPPDDPRSNYRMAKEALLDRVPIPKAHVHRIRGEDVPAEVAEEYEQELSDAGATALDLVLLGLGEDGHTASLFPGQPSVHETARRVLAVPDPDGNLWRVTLTPLLLNAARHITFIVAGASKAARLRQVIEGPLTPDLLPAQAIRPAQGQLTWMVDQAAAADLRADRIST